MHQLPLGHSLFAFIYPSGGHSSTNMSFHLVQIQYFSYLHIQQGIALGKSQLNILVHGGFGNTKVFCSGTDCCAGFDDVHSQFAGSLLNGVTQLPPSDAVC